MRILFFDCFSGASGNMLLGALLGLGFPKENLDAAVKALGFAPSLVKIEPGRASGFASTLVTVDIPKDSPGRHLSDINAMIEGADLPAKVIESAKAVFANLARAEAAVHGMPIDKIHFHEVGAVDALIDIVGVCAGVHFFEADRIIASPLPLGHGTVNCAHGTLPVPVPATVELLAGCPTYDAGRKGEHVTPTGAALLSTLADEFGRPNGFTLDRSAYGAGTRKFDSGPPNLLRAMLGTADDAPESPGELVIETNIDDMSPEFYGPLMDKLFEAGALDVTLTPCIMKKGRPGILLSIIGSRSTREPIVAAVLANSTTIGVRMHEVSRVVCERKIVTVDTPFGAVSIKVAMHKGCATGAKPEFEDCNKLSKKSGVPIQEVYRAALAAFASPKDSS